MTWHKSSDGIECHFNDRIANVWKDTGGRFPQWGWHVYLNSNGEPGKRVADGISWRQKDAKRAASAALNK